MKGTIGSFMGLVGRSCHMKDKIRVHGGRIHCPDCDTSIGCPDMAGLLGEPSNIPVEKQVYCRAIRIRWSHCDLISPNGRLGMMLR